MDLPFTTKSGKHLKSWASMSKNKVTIPQCQLKSSMAALLISHPSSFICGLKLLMACNYLHLQQDDPRCYRGATTTSKVDTLNYGMYFDDQGIQLQVEAVRTARQTAHTKKRAKGGKVISRKQKKSRKGICKYAG